MEFERKYYTDPYLDTEKSLENLARFHQNKDAAAFRSDRLFILLLGPSSVGKSTLIKALNEISGQKFVYPNPYTTREARIGDDKVSVTDEEFDILKKDGTFIQVNQLYGARYGPPIANVRAALSNSKIPILDFPLDKIHELKRPEYDLLHVYVFPPTVEKWVNKLNSLRRNNSQMRLDAGIQEMRILSQSHAPHPDIHFSIVNKENEEYSGAREIISFINSIKAR